MKILFLFPLCLLFINVSCTSQTKNTEEEKWKKKLSNEQYYILREKGTEKALRCSAPLVNIRMPAA